MGCHPALRSGQAPVPTPHPLTPASSARLALSAAIAPLARYSSQNLTPALVTSNAKMIPKPSQRPAADKTAATSIIHGIGLQRYERNSTAGVVVSSCSSLGPNLPSRRYASALPRPSGGVFRRVRSPPTDNPANSSTSSSCTTLPSPVRLPTSTTYATTLQRLDPTLPTGRHSSAQSSDKSGSRSGGTTEACERGRDLTHL